MNYRALLVFFAATCIATAQPTWQVIAPAAGFAPGSGAFTSLAFASRNLGLAAWHGVYATTDNGVTWQRDTSRLFGLNSAIAFPDSLHATTVGASGTIVHTSDGRAHWARQTSGTTYNLAGVAFSDSLNGFAVGGGLDKNGAPHRVALHTTDGGEHWASLIDTSNSELDCVWMFDAHTAIFAGNDGAVLRTTDAGATWTTGAVAATGIHAFAFSDANNGYLVADGLQIFRTIDGGLSWRNQSTGMTGSISFTGVCAPDVNHATIVGNTGVILQTTDAGTTWVSQYSNIGADLFAVIVFDANTAVAVGGDVHSNTSRVIMRTTTMSRMPSIAMNPGRIDFDTVALGSTVTDSFAVLNTGAADLVIKNIMTSGVEFTVQPNTGVVAAGQAMEFYVRFHPVTVVQQTAAAAVYFYGSGSPDSLVLTGRGVGGPVPAYTGPLDFGYVRTGKTVVDSIKVHNRGDRMLTITGITTSDSLFTIGPIPPPLRPGDSTFIGVRFFADPTLADSSRLRLAMLRIAHNGPTSPDSLMLTARSVSPMLNTRVLNFGTVGYGEEKTDTTVMNNAVAQMVNIDSMHITNSRYHVHVWKHTISLGDTTRIMVTFAPDTTALLTGLLIVYHAPYGDPDTVQLSGTGGVLPVQITHDTINFGAVTVKSVAVDSFTVHNFGTTPYIANDVHTDDKAFTVDAPSFTIAPGSQKTVHVTFAPTTVTSYSKLVVIDDNSTYSPHVVYLFATVLTGVNDAAAQPASPLMLQAYPNPVIDHAAFAFTLPRDARATVKIFSEVGACVATIGDEQMRAGAHIIETTLDHLPAGVYRTVLRAGGSSAEVPLVIVR